MLRGYSFSKALGRYRSLASGRIVSRSTISKLLDRSIAQREDRIHSHVTAAIEGRISPNTFAMLETRLIKRQALQSAALAKGGWDRLTQKDYGRVGALLRVQYAKIAGMAEQIKQGNISIAQAQNWTSRYMGEIRALALRTERENQPPPKAGKTRLERRLLGQAEHCDDCVTYYQMGWQPAGTLPVPGEGTVCDGSCRCTLQQKDVDDAEALAYFGKARPGGPVLASKTGG